MKYTRILEEQGKYILSPYGLYHAFMFEGDANFIRKCENLVRNFGILKGGKFTRYSENIWFCLSPLDAIKKGMKEAFLSEVLYHKDVPCVIKTEESADFDEIRVDFDENLAETLASNLVEDFFANKLEYKNYFSWENNTYYDHEYSLGTINESEQDKIIE